MASFFEVPEGVVLMSIHKSMKRAIEHFNSGNISAYLDIYDSKCTIHGVPPGSSCDMEGARQFYDGLIAAFPGAHLTLEDVLVDGEKAACRYTFRGTHKGDFMGLSPTGKMVTMTGMTILHFSGAKCIERWNEADIMGLMQQLGAVPAASGATRG
ncbi:MAG: ester cyclase [Armatimonadetes bacterium]|nr:ester cyclase [Armatimonadota bacterium]